MRLFLTPTAQVGGERLTRKRRRASRSRRWGTGSGRRLPSGGPSSPVRRSRTCSYPGASPIFAPFVWSLPPTCCPLLRSVPFLGLMSVVKLKTHTQKTHNTINLYKQRSHILGKNKTLSQCVAHRGIRKHLHSIIEYVRPGWQLPSMFYSRF